ncbi:Quino protein alcohol dehydrogenase-like protein, partial [Thozetella sp. PMI_491]
SRRGSWLGWGAGIYNNHWAGSDAVVNKSNAKLLAQVCTKKYSPGVSAAPFIENGIAYYPTWSGLVVALDYRRCRTIWQTNVTRLILEFRPLNPNQTFLPVLSRTTPAVDGDVLFIGSQAQALLMALDKRTGRLVDAVQVDEHPSAVLTQSPTVYKGLILIGVSSLEEATASIVPDYECCTFVGSMNAFVLRYGRLRRIWKTAMIPTGSELSGVAVWGGQPSIDPIRNQVFIGSGNMYSLTEPFEECHDATVNLTVVGDGQVGAQCLPKGVMLDSVVALDIPTGRINWVKRLGPLDPWNTACVPDLIAPGSGGGPQCNFTAGPDVDLGMAPTFILGSAHTPDGLDMLVVGQKSSALWGLSAQTGKVLWMTSTGPTGLEGGLIWGVAADDRQVYYTVVNWNRVNYTLPAGDGKTVISNSAFGAASLKDGKIAWQI